MTPASHGDALRMAGQIEPQKPGRAGDGCVALLDQAIVSGEVRLCWHAQDLDPGAAIRRRLVLARSARLSCSPNGPRRTWASCPGINPPSRDTISFCSHDHSPLRRGGVRPAIPRILTWHARGRFVPANAGETFRYVTCPGMRGAHAHYRLRVVPGHHPGITRGRVNLAAPARRGVPRPRPPGGSAIQTDNSVSVQSRQPGVPRPTGPRVQRAALLRRLESAGEPAAAEFHVEDHPDPLDLDVLETQIRREASAAMGLSDEADPAIFVRDAGRRRRFRCVPQALPGSPPLACRFNPTSSVISPPRSSMA